LETKLEASTFVANARLQEFTATTIHRHGLSAVIGEINGSALSLAK
jgi:hypothetical protein